MYVSFGRSVFGPKGTIATTWVTPITSLATQKTRTVSGPAFKIVKVNDPPDGPGVTFAENLSSERLHLEPAALS